MPGKQYFVEFWDIGGHPKYKVSRDVFYSQINGLIIMFDLVNSKSYHNMRKWIREIVEVDKIKGIEEHYIHADVGSGTRRRPDTAKSKGAPSSSISALVG